MSRFVSDNHPKRGLCTMCSKVRLLVGDLGIDVMLITGNSGFLQSVQARNGVLPRLFKHAFCSTCFRIATKNGPPQVHLSSRGMLKRLTRKQTIKAAKKLAYQLKKMQDES